jgi:hypothetical protein
MLIYLAYIIYIEAVYNKKLLKLYYVHKANIWWSPIDKYFIFLIMLGIIVILFYNFGPK